jgi:transketolase
MALERRANALRRLAIDAIYSAQSGHPGGSLSLAEIMAALYFHELRIDPEKPGDPARDRVVLSKGHAAPIWYAALAEKGFFPKSELGRLRKIDSLLQGHPCIAIPGVDLTTGSLGMGLSGAVGIAIGAKMQNSQARVYAILGDGEQDEGQIWEAAMSAAHFELDNIVGITDRNMYQNDGPTSATMELEPLAGKWRAFGWNVLEIDGNCISAILGAFGIARATKKRPTMLMARTVKGKGASFLVDRPELHYTPPTKEQRDAAIRELDAAIRGDAACKPGVAP